MLAVEPLLFFVESSTRAQGRDASKHTRIKVMQLVNAGRLETAIAYFSENADAFRLRCGFPRLCLWDSG